MFEIFKRTPKIKERTPVVGEPVWWAPKRERCVVTESHLDGSFVFQGGRVVRNKRGRQVMRWTVAARYRGVGCAKWNPEVGCWVVGQGPTPKRGRDHQIVYPDPVQMTNDAKGSFAVES